MTPLIIDTDPGVDDAFALAVACLAPEVDLLAVTTVHGNVPVEQTTENARRLLGTFGRPDVPVGRGADRPLVHLLDRRSDDVHGDDGLGGRSGDFGPPVDESPLRAVALMASVLEQATEPVTIAAIGPYTNVATLLSARPDLEERIGRFVLMGGSIAFGGNVTAAAEFNVWGDPEAARRVLAGSVVPTTLVPLDLTMRITLSDAWLDDLAQASPIGAALSSTREAYLAAYSARFGTPAIPVHDAVAVLEAIAPGSVRTMSMPVDVDTSSGPGRGATIGDMRGAEAVVLGRPVDVALDADATFVRAELRRRLGAPRG
ncbi:nucleoside hydrolase [Actinomycetospora sp. NBRC 106378]|uniref:nucleoside hydrolase n=1 Tax=Actinomycetospora sp. NBRC 106378 TaxID=3032208 RepID=UPI0024A0C07B|nr:nucleoside hydrolase [Actinomycetospora sp. NBRC 106378]GLZ55891.1 purine nucleosidase [Actinomycetospora sp. NBRC 106378]